VALSHAPGDRQWQLRTTEYYNICLQHPVGGHRTLAHHVPDHGKHGLHVCEHIQNTVIVLLKTESQIVYYQEHQAPCAVHTSRTAHVPVKWRHHSSGSRLSSHAWLTARFSTCSHSHVPPPSVPGFHISMFGNRPVLRRDLFLSKLWDERRSHFRPDRND
jgi:hypothetical protein